MRRFSLGARRAFAQRASPRTLGDFVAWHWSIPFAVSLVIPAVPIEAREKVQRVPSALVTQKDPSVCNQIMNAIRQFSPKAFESGRILRALGVRWETAAMPWKDFSGSLNAGQARYVRFDLENNGKTKVIISLRGNIRTMEYEYWLVLSESEFETAQRDGLQGPVEQISGEDVDSYATDFFTGPNLGEFIVPWTYAGRNYVVFQAVGYGQRSPTPDPNWIVVTQYESSPTGLLYRWRAMKPLCVIADKVRKK